MERNHLVLIGLAFALIASGCAGDYGDADEELPGDEEVPAPGDELPGDEEDEDVTEAPEDDEQEAANGDEAEASEDEDEVREITVEGGSFWFDSDEIEVEAGETVRFTFENVEGTHDMVFPELGAGTDVISEGESETFEVTFDEEGEYEFICSVGNHAEQGMTGTVEVV